MGANSFVTRATGKTASEAFSAACVQAAYDYGHGGYTGTIAEKSDFVTIPLPHVMPTINRAPTPYQRRNEGGKMEMAYLPNDPGPMSPEEYAWHLIDKRDSRIDDKWGPAGCIEVAPGKYLFFGVASS